MIKILENFEDYLRPGSNPHECKIKLDNGSYKMLKMKRVILGGNKIAELGAQQFLFFRDNVLRIMLQAKNVKPLVLKRSWSKE